MKKRFFTILTALALCLSLLPTAAYAEGLIGQDEAPGTVNLENNYNSGSPSASSLIGGLGGRALTDDETSLTCGDYYLNCNVTLKQEEPLLITGTVTLDLKGHVLEKAGSGSVIKVASGGNLTLTDSNATVEHKFTSDEYGVWTLSEDGTNSVNGGVIAGGSEGLGGGVRVEEGGALTMTGGNIAGCRASYGGGVYVFGGGTLVSSTTTSPCTYAVEPQCTGRYARWCERSALYSEILLLDCSGVYSK